MVPWSNPDSYPFSRASVDLSAPEESGIYVLRSETTWVYIGEAENIRARLIQHLSGDTACLSVFPRLTFSYELIIPATRAWRHEELVREFRPLCNPTPR